MSLNSSEEDSDHPCKLENKMGKNMKMQQRQLKVTEKEKASRTKKVYKGNSKRKVEETEKDGNDKKYWNDKP